MSFDIFWRQPWILSVIAGVGLILTELVKWPIKAKVNKSVAKAWVYILMSLIITTGVYVAAIFIYPKFLPNDSGVVASWNWNEWGTIVALEQAMYNLIWEKGLKAILVAIFSKLFKKDSKVVEEVVDSTGVGEALDKTTEKIKSKQDKPQLETTASKIQNGVQRSNKRPKI